MAVCRRCNLEMMTAASCDEDPAAIRYGQEKRSGGWPEGSAKHRCHDCGILPGGIHHEHCDMEECPSCGGQRLACGCTLVELEGVAH